MKSHARKDLEQPDLIELLQLDEEGFKSRFAGSPILRTKRRGLLRNVCVALGNVGDDIRPARFGKSRRRFRTVDCRTRALGDCGNRIAAEIIYSGNRVQLLLAIGCGCAPSGGADVLDVVSRDFAGLVAPRTADVSQHGGKVGVGQRRAHRGHVAGSNPCLRP